MFFKGKTIQSYMITMFPPRLVNRRVRNGIKECYRQLKDIFKEKGWKWEDPQPKPTSSQWHAATHWRHPDAEFLLTGYHSDGAVKEITIVYHRLPSFVRPCFERNCLSFDHAFVIQLPRAYPSRLNRIRIIPKSKIYQPRLPPCSLTTDACIFIPGEIERIFLELLYHLLMKPDKIQPPTPQKPYLGKKECMDWYVNHMDKIITFLEKEWEKIHEKTLTTAKPKKSSQVILLDE